jgi:ACT domain-containing protein
MANEQLIYQLTRAVYDRLGASADKQLVENLVTDIYRLVEAGGGAGGEGRSGRVVISAFGISHPGIVAAIASTLAEARYDIVDINQTVVQGKFAMVLIADAGEAAGDLASLKVRLREVGERLGVRVYAQREDLFQAMHRV